MSRSWGNVELAEVPLPDRRALLASSAWAQGRPGLVEAAGEWLATLPAERDRVVARARIQAQPRLWPDTMAALARTGWRVAAATAPEAPGLLLSAGARRFGLPIGPPDPAAGLLTRIEGLVRSGGPAYVKLGQFIATARGVLPDDWVEAFAWCHDRYPPMRPGGAARIVERAFRMPVDDLFASFEAEPLGSASIGQVHGAVLADGTEVVVKVRRPGLRPKVDEAVRAMALLAAGAEEALEPARLANLRGAVELFAELVHQELDFRFEALNMVEMGLVVEAGGHGATIPRPIPGLVTPRVVVMERVPGVPYGEAAARFGADLDGRALLRQAVEGVLEHALVYGLFHGDLHSGNVLVSGGDHFSLVDFGICGRIDARGRGALVRLVAGYAADDTAGQLAALRELDALPPDADLDRLTAVLVAARAQLAADLGVDPSDREALAALGLPELAQAMRASLQALSAEGFRLPTALALFLKNLLYLNGFAAAVAPDADVAAELAPVVAEFLVTHGATLAPLLAR